MEFWPDLEDCFIRCPHDSNLEGISSEIISNFLQEKYRTNLEVHLCEELLSSSILGDNLEHSLKTNIEEKLNLDTDKITRYEVLCIGISSLQLFVQVNWTGPQDVNSYNPPLQFLRKCFMRTDDCSDGQWIERVTSNLVLDGEAISPNIRNLELLLVARAVLNASSYDGMYSAIWWRLRCLFMHQQVLEERSPTLYNQLGHLITQITECEVVSTSALSAQFELESASVWLYYGHVGKADEAIKVAYKRLGLNLNLIGALGKRTKFQEKVVAQLTLGVDVTRNIEVDGSLDATMVSEADHFPKDVKLEDDVRLNQIAFSDLSAGQFPLLTPAEQAAVLATCMYKQKSEPKDRLHSEEILPYLTCLTAQPRIWAIQMSALLHRSKLDSDHKRTIERSLMQFQNLSDCVRGLEPEARVRISWVYCSYLPPAWRIDAMLAHTYISLGMVQTALDVFLSLQLWEEVIACYNFLKLRHKAEEVIRQELEKKPSVKLLCLLGDATDDVDYYRQAWELSGEKSGMAQRHWAMHYFTRKQYGESIPHLEKSLSLNSLQVSLWFRLGYAALDQENWPLCATAYRRYCTLEPESFEAWNNLAKAYVKIGQKARAYRALQEAVKCNYENWRVWDNLMAVSTDCAQFDEVIRCYHRILDLNEKHIDVEVLKILTNVVVQDLVNTKEYSTEKLRKQSLTLFGRLTSQVLNNSTLWRLYAQLAASDEPTSENRVKVAQCLQKAYRAATQGCWEQDVTSCLQVIDLCVDLAQAYLLCSSQYASSNERIQMLSSAKLSLKSVLSKIEKVQTDLITGDLPASLSVQYKSLVAKYEMILDEIQRLQTI